VNSFFEEATARLSGGASSGRPINVSRFNHQDIVDGLHRLFFHAPDEPPPSWRGELRILHGDGSESQRFHIEPLGPAPSWDKKVAPLRIGFNSGRHPELDKVADFYLIRNRELEALDSGADREQEVYERTIRLFSDPAFEKPWVVEVYHTGLEVLTVAFYRAVADLARRRRQVGLPGVPLLPLTWAAGRCDLAEVVREARGALKMAPLLAAAERMVGRLPAFLSLERPAEGQPEGGKVHWLLERPMLPAERDWLARCAPAGKLVWTELLLRTRYREQRVWGLG
jgi:hypothetical protein